MEDQNKKLIKSELLPSNDNDTDSDDFDIEITDANKPKPKIYDRLFLFIETRFGCAICILFLALVIFLVIGFLIYSNPANE